MKQLLTLILLGGILLNHQVFAASPLWFSEQPPDKSILQDMQMRHGGYVKVVDGIDTKQLWLREGSGLHQSTFVKDGQGEYFLMDVREVMNAPKIINQDSQTSIRFPMPDEGFYNAYFVKRWLDHDILHVKTAKAEVLNHNCRKGHKYDRNLVKPHHWNAAPLEIVRLRLADEDFHTRIRSGTEIDFQVFHQGEPVPGATVTLETMRGWVKAVQSDAQGIARFQIIQDNFLNEHQAGEKETKKAWPKKTADAVSASHSIEKAEAKKIERGYGGRIRIRDNFLVTAEYQTDFSGIFENQPYQQTLYSVSMTGRYYPNQLANQSSWLGLLFVSAGVLVISVGAYIYRSRRIKPFRDEVFDEHES